MKILLTLFILIFQIWSCSSTDSNDNILAPGDDSSQTGSNIKKPTKEHTNSKGEVGTFNDSRDAPVSRPTAIGEQVWMAENLRYLPEKDGKFTPDSGSIYRIYGYEIDTDRKLEVAKNDINFLDFGVMYNWQAGMQDCPEGWSLPNKEDIEQLIEHVNDSLFARLAAKYAWGINATPKDDYGFGLYPGGTCYPKNCRGMYDYTKLLFYSRDSIYFTPYNFKLDSLFSESIVITDSMHASYVRCIKRNKEPWALYIEDYNKIYNMKKGDSHSLKAKFYPFHEKSHSIKWKSSDESVATVDSKGVVQAKGFGSAIITVSSTKNKDLVDSCLVWVKEYFIDERDGNVYSMIPIGDQVWMAENLRYAIEEDSIIISWLTPNFYAYKAYFTAPLLTAHIFSNPFSHWYRYNFPAASEACPQGWRLPDTSDWRELVDFIGAENFSYSDLQAFLITAKEADLTLQNIENHIPLPLGMLKSYSYGMDKYGFSSIGQTLSSNRSGSAIAYPEISTTDHYRVWWASNIWIPEKNTEAFTYEGDLSSAVFDPSDTSSTNPIHIKDRFSTNSVRCIKGVTKPSFVYLSDNYLLLDVNSTHELKAIVYPPTSENKNIIWSSSNESAASIDQNGTITTKNSAHTMITVTTEVANRSDSISVWVKDKFTDERDGNTYYFVEIGTQTWMAENLRYAPVIHYKDSSFFEERYYIADYHSLDIEEAKSSTRYATIGVNYNWPASLTACPEGWRLPDTSDFATLFDYSGDIDEAGRHL